MHSGTCWIVLSSTLVVCATPSVPREVEQTEVALLVAPNPVVIVELRFSLRDGHNEMADHVQRFEVESGCIRELERVDPRGMGSSETHDCSAVDRVRTTLAELLEGVDTLASDPLFDDPEIGRLTLDLVLERADGTRWLVPDLDGEAHRLLELLGDLDDRPEPPATPRGARGLRLTRFTASSLTHSRTLDAAGNWSCTIVHEGPCATRPDWYCFDDRPHWRNYLGQSPPGPAAQLLDSLAGPDHGPGVANWSVFVAGVDDVDRPATAAAIAEWNQFAATLDPNCIIEIDGGE